LQALDQIDALSTDTLNTLVNQRERFKKNINDVMKIQVEVSQGSRVISRMRKRQIRNKILLLIIILILIVAIGVINPFIIKPLKKKHEE